MLNKQLEFIVPPEWNDKNANDFLRYYCKVSARMITRLKRENNGITRNSVLLRTIDKVYENDKIILKLPIDNNKITPVKGNLNILFEDEYVLIVDKPYNMPVHPTKIHQNDTLANLVIYHQLSNKENFTFRAINRLDKDTSGIVVIAKDRYTASSLFGNLQKIYYAICEGEITNNGTINRPIGLMEGHTIQRCIREDGEKSITHYKVIKNINNHTYLEIQLETGHTHQIRCHFSGIGYPLAGDDMYGGEIKFISRQALHCGKVMFIHPITNKEITITSDTPEDMMILLK